MDRFIRFEYTDKDFSANHDYKNQPVCSLDSALEPIVSCVDHLNHYIGKARKARHFPSEHGLTEDESVAIYLYTHDWGDRSLHRVLNHILQCKDRTKVTPWFGFLKLFNRALDKLPTIKNTIWRGLPISIAEKLQVDEELVLCRINSCSSSADVIKTCLNSSSILCSIDPLNGKDVRDYAPHPHDQEVVLRPGTRLRVKSKQLNNKNHKLIVRFEEISGIGDDEAVSSDALIASKNRSTNEGDSKDPDHQNADATKGSKEGVIQAVVTFVNGDRYTLSCFHGKKLGYGKYKSIDGEILKDQPADDKANGEGICRFKDGTSFIGTFKRGTKHGPGILYNIDEKIQADIWSRDEPSGAYWSTKSGDRCYTWRNTKREYLRYRAYDDNNRNKYIGQVLDGKAHGLGIRIWSDSSRYEGHFENDKKHGYGIYSYANNAKYTGEWTADKINGKGTLQWVSGSRYTGTFKNGKKHGEGKLTFACGRIQDGQWKNDTYIG